ncbi:hypothetical protein [Candidatus Uabimicrobium sp. HlEnr_7]|uniref:hypothetical protein n=1 Tax=Candidatus Uabimicrobium helgolandensis TaxID=3095367 RepID=UPI00355929FB
MAKDISIQLNKAYYICSKVSHYPIFKSKLSGIFVMLFRYKKDIKEYLQHTSQNIRNFEIIRLESFYDFMRDMANMGFTGIWYFKNFPIFFANYLSDIDLELPTFAYTPYEHFISALGKVNRPIIFRSWKNYSKIDKVIRRCLHKEIPFSLKDNLFTIVIRNKEDCAITITNKGYIKTTHCAFLNGSSLHGPYTSDMGAYCLFTGKKNAEIFFKSYGLDNSAYKIQEIDDIFLFLSEISYTYPFYDIGLNPELGRHLQGYFIIEKEKYYIKTVLGTYKLTNKGGLCKVGNTVKTSKKDTVDYPNTIDPTLRQFKTSIEIPLKKHLSKTKSTISRKEVQELINKLVKKDTYKKQPLKDIEADSYLVFAFDKITGISMSNSDIFEVIVFTDILHAISYFYHVLFPEEFRLNIEGFYHSQSDTLHKGFDEDIEQYILAERKTALKNLLEIVLLDGCKVEHSELLKFFINRTSMTLEIEECGYLGDLGIHKEYLSYPDSIALKIKNHIKKVNERLDKRIQAKIKFSLGHTYEHLLFKCRLILETAIRQFEAIEKKYNYDYAGTTMKTCKVFEIELKKLILQIWKETKKNTNVKNLNKKEKKLVKKLEAKLMLGPMKSILKNLREESEPLHTNLRNNMLRLNNGSFILSEEFQNIIENVSKNYRNGGVHAEIISYEICTEAFQSILLNSNNYLKRILDT